MVEVGDEVLRPGRFANRSARPRSHGSVRPTATVAGYAEGGPASIRTALQSALSHLTRRGADSGE